MKKMGLWDKKDKIIEKRKKGSKMLKKKRETDMKKILAMKYEKKRPIQLKIIKPEVDRWLYY